MKDDSLYIEQLLDAAQKIHLFTSGVSLEEFLVNQEKQSAVILQLILMGELANKLSDEFRDRVDLPWRQIIGLRNRAVHDYLQLDVEDIWKTVCEDIPHLVGVIERAVA